MKRLALGFVLALVGCEAEPEMGTPEPGTPPAESLDTALLRELLGESVQVDGETIRTDGLLVRLAFEPLIRQTGPVTLQLAQGHGYRLTGVADHSPLWLLGLRDADVLTHVDGIPILGREHELRGVFEARPARVVITTTRGTETKTLRLQIAASPSWRSVIEPNSPTERLGERRLPPPLPSSADRSRIAAEFAEHLRCVASESSGKIGRCEIERTAFEGLIANPTPLIAQARVVPSTLEGEVVGFKLFGIRRDSIPSRIGLQNGDMLQRVNDRPIRDLDGALEAWTSLRDETKLTLSIERRNQTTTLELEIVDALSGPPASSSPLPSTSIGPVRGL